MNLALLLMFSTPLALAALGELVSQRSGVINIGLEGMMLIGAFLGVFVVQSHGGLILAFLFTAIVGGLLGLGSGWFTVKLDADQVVVGTAINFLALGATGLAYRSAYGTSGQLLNTTKLPSAGGIDPMIVLMLASLVAVNALVYRSNWGLALRSAGGYPKAAEAAGFSVVKLRLQAVTIGGMFAGLAGAYLSLGVANSFAEGMTAGRGFLAIALVTFGRWRPLWTTLAALLLGYCQSLNYSLQGSGGIPSQLWLALPYLVALLVLIVVGKGTIAPGALGVAYNKEE